jgi:hypothetical protein
MKGLLSIVAAAAAVVALGSLLPDPAAAAPAAAISGTGDAKSYPSLGVRFAIRSGLSVYGGELLAG